MEDPQMPNKYPKWEYGKNHGTNYVEIIKATLKKIFLGIFLVLFFLILTPKAKALTATITPDTLCVYQGSSSCDTPDDSYIRSGSGEFMGGSYTLPAGTINSVIWHGYFINVFGHSNVITVASTTSVTDPMNTYTATGSVCATGSVNHQGDANCMLSGTYIGGQNLALQWRSNGDDTHWAETDSANVYLIVDYIAGGGEEATSSTSTAISVDQTPHIIFYAIIIFLFAFIIGRSL